MISAEATLNIEDRRGDSCSLPIRRLPRPGAMSLLLDHQHRAEARRPPSTCDCGYWPRARRLHLLRAHADEQRDEIRPASPVNVLGKIDGDPKVFKSVVRAGAR